MYRLILCIDLLVWYIRSLGIFMCFQTLGPKLIMIRKSQILFSYTLNKVNFIFFILNLSGKIVYYWKLIIQNNNRDLLLNPCTDVGYFIIYYHRFCIFIGLWSYNSRYKLFF